MRRLEDVEAVLRPATFYQVQDLPGPTYKADVHRACRQLSTACHPDKFVTYKEWATTAFKQVQQVRDTLCNPELRPIYDAQLRSAWPHRHLRPLRCFVRRMPPPPSAPGASHLPRPRRLVVGDWLLRLVVLVAR